MTDSGSEGLGFESQRDHERLKASKKKVHFQFFGAFKFFVGWLAPAYRNRRSQFNGITKSIQRDHERLSSRVSVALQMSRAKSFNEWKRA